MTHWKIWIVSVFVFSAQVYKAWAFEYVYFPGRCRSFDTLGDFDLQYVRSRSECIQLCNRAEYRGYEFRKEDGRCELHRQRITGIKKDSDYGCYKKVGEIVGDECFKKVVNSAGDSGFCRASGGVDYYKYKLAVTRADCRDECYSDTDCQGYEWGTKSNACELHRKRPTYPSNDSKKGVCYYKDDDSCRERRLQSDQEHVDKPTQKVEIQPESKNLRQG